MREERREERREKVGSEISKSGSDLSLQSPLCPCFLTLQTYRGHATIISFP